MTQNQHNPNPPQDDGLYELNLPQDEQPSPPPPPPASPSKAAKPREPKPVSDTALPADFQPAPLPEPSAPPPAPLAAPTDVAFPGGERQPEKKTPKIYAEESEPAYVDPHVAARKREQARIRAAEQLAIETAAVRRRRMILLAVMAALAAAATIVIGITRS